MATDLLVYILLGLTQGVTAAWGGIVSARSLQRGRERNAHIGIFAVMFVFGTALVVWSGLRASASQKENDRAQDQLRADVREARQKMDQSLLSQENMKGQLGALSVVLGKFVESGRGADLNKVAEITAQILKTTSTQNPAQPMLTLAPTPGRVTVTGMTPEGVKTIAAIDGRQISATAKPLGTFYVVVLVSALTRSKGSPNVETIQKVVDSLKGISRMEVFFCDAGYSVIRGNVVNAFGGGGGGLSMTDVSEAVFYYDKKAEETAKIVRATVERVIGIKYFQYRPIPNSADLDTSHLLYRDFWLASGVDIEVIL